MKVDRALNDSASWRILRAASLVSAHDRMPPFRVHGYAQRGYINESNFERLRETIYIYISMGYILENILKKQLNEKLVEEMIPHDILFSNCWQNLFKILPTIRKQFEWYVLR